MAVGSQAFAAAATRCCRYPPGSLRGRRAAAAPGSQPLLARAMVEAQRLTGKNRASAADSAATAAGTEGHCAAGSQTVMVNQSVFAPGIVNSIGVSWSQMLDQTPPSKIFGLTVSPLVEVVISSRPTVAWC